MNKKRIIAVAVGAIIACFVVISLIDNIAEAQPQTNGFKAEAIEHDGLSYELVGSRYTDDLHTFEFSVKNIGDSPVKLSSVFAITNGDKRYKSSDVTYSDRELNPDMSGTIDVTFEMSGEALSEGSPVIEIDRGLIFADIVEIPLVK